MEKRLGITMGDAAGVGPELILKVLKDYQERVIIYGSLSVLDYYNNTFAYGYKLLRIIDPADCREGHVNIIDPSDLQYSDFEIGKVSPLCGKSAYLYLQEAIADAMAGKISGIVTCPLNKEALHLGGYDYAGHTEILAKLTKTAAYGMLLWSEKLRTIHVSTHLSLKEAVARVKKDRIKEVVYLAEETLQKAAFTRRKIAVAGLNPHAGENGLFGDEEIKEIIPAVSELKQEGYDVDGPIPPDTVFLKALKGEYDLVVAMYHDQGHIPLKLLAFDGGVNITVGLPIIRTSVDHGTAFDIAGKNIAKTDSLLAALKIAEKLAD